MSWRKARLDSIADLCLGKMLDQNKNRGEMLPYLANVDVRWGEFDLSDLRQMRFESHEMDRYGLKFGDIVMCEGGEPGRCALWKDQMPGLMIQKALHRIRPRAGIDNRFLYYTFLHKGRAGGFGHLFTGATIKHLPGQNLAKLEIEFPEQVVQQRIASILSAYDEAQENNRRRMALLEKPARLLYEEWFVRLRFPGHEHCLISQGVPRGWEAVRLSELIDLKHGYAFSGEHFSDTPTSRVLTTPGSFRAGGGIKIDKPKFYSDEGPLDSSYILAPMDLIVTMTDLSVMSDTLGYPAFVPRLDGVSFLHNQRVGKVVPNSAWFPRHFLFHSMCSQNYRQHVLGSATGTAVKHTAPKRILSYYIVMPKAPTLVNEFEAAVNPIYRQIGTLMQMNEKLRIARDLLLPRLMSGEIAV